MRAILCILVLAFTLLLSGCATELGERAIIQAAAVDYADDKYTVNALLFSGGTDPSQENVIKVSGSGTTLSEAVKEIALICGKEIYMAENKLLVIGSGFEDKSVAELVNAMYFDMRCSLNMPVCCAENAELLADIRFVEGITSAEKPVEILRTANRIGASPYTTLMDILTANEGGRSTLIPMFSEGINGEGLTSDEDGKLPVLSGSRVLYEGRLYGEFDNAATEGLMLLSGDSDTCYFSFILGGREYSVEAYSVTAEIQGGERAVSVSAGFRQENGAALTGEALAAAEEHLKSIIENALELAA